MSKRHVESHKSHPMAYLLVYGFGFVSLMSSSFGAFAAYKIFFQSKLVASIVFSIILHRFFRIAGGVNGINRTVGDGKLSVHQELLAKGDEKPPGTMRIVVISDTHCHNLEQLPKGDILVHCGDFTMKGSSDEIQEFCHWLEKQPFEHKILIAGNHDMGLEFLRTEEVKMAHARLQSICTLLENSGTSVNGLNFWGSPQTPYISKKRRMGFQDASENLVPFWDKIPENVDILITHGPPQGYGDRILLGMHVGCPELMKRVAKVKPRYHLFGHIHEAYGTYPSALGCLFINAAICNTLYKPIHPPLVLDIPIMS